MKEETADALARAREQLAEAEKILEIDIPSVAAKQAYLAALTAARGLTFELLGKGPKTHKGVKALVHQLVRGGLTIDRSLLAILDSGFEMKVEADYGDPENIHAVHARDAIAVAAALISQIEQIVATKD